MKNIEGKAWIRIRSRVLDPDKNEMKMLDADQIYKKNRKHRENEKGQRTKDHK
jgi:hypothetical protein